MTDSALNRLRMEVAQQFEFWRGRLLSPEALAKLASELGIGRFTAADVTGLWTLGILRADLVRSDEPMNDAGLHTIVGVAEPDEFAYCDYRQLTRREGGLGSALKDHDKGQLVESLAFHPFRVYVLHHVERTLKTGTSSMQFLNYEPGILRLAARMRDDSVRWTSSLSFVERFEYWNQVAETAAVVEPITFDVVFRDAPPTPIGLCLAGTYQIALGERLTAMGKPLLRQMITDLAFAAESLDENRSVHVLIRLMKWRERERIKGRLGGAMNFLGTAEIIRRGAERTFGEAWPEEDEIGPGQWMDGARKMLYGHERVFDAPRRYLRDYLTQLGLDYGVKARCYVEGDTEFGALAHAVGSWDHVQVINLNGNFAERHGRGLAFARSLEADLNAGIFSIVVLDGDVEEYLRILRRAVEDGKFHGRFFIHQPDFEFGNFSSSELIEAAVIQCQKSWPCQSDPTSIKAAMHLEANEIHNNGGLIDLARRNGLTNFRKNEGWGKALMEFAIAHPLFDCSDSRAGQQRPILDAASLLLRMRDIGFMRSISAEKVDPQSGQTVPVINGQRQTRI